MNSSAADSIRPRAPVEATKLGRGGRALVVLAAVTLTLGGIKLAASIFVPFFLASFFAVVTAPIVLRVRARGAPLLLAVALGFFLDMAAIAVLVAFALGSLRALYERLPEYQEHASAFVASVAAYLSAFDVPLTSTELEQIVDPAEVLGVVGNALRGVARAAASTSLMLVLLLFMLLEAAGIRDKLSAVAGPGTRSNGQLLRTSLEVQKYLVVKALASLATGILVGFWVYAMGFDLPVLWGFLSFALNFIPTIGSIIAAVPAMLLSLITHGATYSLTLGAGYLAANLFIGNFVEPRILGRTLGLSPLVVVLSVVLWGYLLGPVGAFVSVPLTMIVKIFLYSNEDLRWFAVLIGPPREARHERRKHALRAPG